MPNFSGIWNLKEQVQAIAAGRWTGITTGELYAWGYNTQGNLGDGTTAPRSSPTQIGDLTDWSQIASGFLHTMSIKKDGTLWGWGRNSYGGSLGDGTAISRSSPVQIGALTGWAQVSAGYAHTASVKTDGTLWAWGNNSSGQVGDNTVVSKSSPVQIGALTNWAQVSAGRSGATASIKTDGTLWAWGFNGSGRLGDGTTIPRSSPVQIGALTGWAQVSAGGAHTLSVKTDGTLWAWGFNGSGTLGDGTTIPRSSPVQIGALTNWTQVSGGLAAFAAAIKNDGTLWVWGSGAQGQIGDNTTTDKSSPTQVGALTTWAQVSAGGYHVAAIKTDKTLWAWGDGSYGRLGDGSVVSKSSPVQIGALANWSEVSAGRASTAAILQGKTN